MLRLDKSVQGVIFDLDGTLVDSMWVWGDIDIHYLGSFGIAVPEDLQVLLGGLSFRQTAHYFRDHFGIRDPVEVIEATWNRMARDRYRDEVKLKTGAAAFLAHIRDRGIPVGIATSNSRELVDVLLDRQYSYVGIGMNTDAQMRNMYVGKHIKE